MDGVGHTNESIRSMLRSGTIERVEPAQLKLADSPFFHSAVRKQEVVFVREDRIHKLPPHLRSHPDLVYRYPKGEPPTEPTKKYMWVDIPLLVNKQVVGKLSCDIDGSAQEGQAEVYETFIRDHVRTATTYLEDLSRNDMFFVSRAGQRIMACRSYDELYNYCTDELRQALPFDFEHATILALARESRNDPDGFERLLLRGASLAKLKGEIHVRNYRKDMVGGLTVWVWKQGRSLVLNCLNQKQERARQLEALDPPTLWLRRVPTGEADHSLLLVPIHFSDKHGRRVIGVIRFADKRVAGGTDRPPIEQRERRLLERIADRFLGPKMKSLMYETFHRQVVNNLTHFDEIVLPNGSDGRLWSAAVKSGIERLLTKLFFVEGGHRLFLVNRIDETDPTKFRPVIVAGEAANDFQKEHGNERFNLEGSLTKYVMEMWEKAAGSRAANPNVADASPQGQWVYILDLERAYARGRFHQSLPAAKCALASPIQYGGKAYGAVVVLSERYDITAAHYGRVLDLIGLRLGQLFARMDFTDYHGMIRGLIHDGQNLVGSVIDSLENAAASCPAGVLEPARAPLYYLLDAISTHCLTEPPAPETLQELLRGPARNIRRVIERIIPPALSSASVKGVKCAAGAPDDHVEVEVAADLKAHVYVPFLSVIVYNLLVNALKARQPHTAKVRVSAELAPAGLIVSVTNPVTPADYQQIAAAANRPVINADGFVYGHTACGSRDPSRGDGLRIIRRVLGWHRLPGSPSGGRIELVHSPSQDTACLRCTLPVGSESEPYRKELSHVAARPADPPPQDGLRR